ncbi:MAG: hypothetical protein V1706_12715 [Pseudomonadota bacterium]
MAKIKIFTIGNVRRYGFTDEEIDTLNVEWEARATGLGLAEHMPEYWQEAKLHMNQILEGRVVADVHGGFDALPDEGQADLPSLDVDIDDLTVFEEIPEEVVLEEIVDLESIDVAGLENPGEISEQEELLPEVTALDDVAEEDVEGVEEKLSASDATVFEKVSEESVQEYDKAEELEIVPALNPLDEVLGKQGEDAVAGVVEDDQISILEAASEETGDSQVGERVVEKIMGEENAIAEEKASKSASFFGRIFYRLKRLFWV